ncbi:MAG: ATP-binding cassette domain-containing protein, partial [Oscillospiraceae bacterium]|nr:ATP-binding cassette domain-containing protein [Oscillospiraceae bacterium]
MTVAEKILSAAVVALFWLGLWLLLSIKTGSELLLPSPFTVLKRLAELAGTAELWQATGLTLLRIIAGYAAGVFAGTLLAALTAWSRHISALTSPLGRIIKATPVASFIILALVWIPANNIPSFIVFLMVTPIVWEALKTALLSTDPLLLEMARAYRFGPVKTVLKVYLPASLNAYLSSLLTSLGLAWKAGIAAEVLCLPKISIGRRLYESKIYLETPDLFAWTTLVIILSVLMELLIRLAVKKALPRKAAVKAEEPADEASEPDETVTPDETATIDETAAPEEPAGPVVNISVLSKYYGDAPVFVELDLVIGPGTICLTGPSGSGKTTLARILADIEDADSGAISGLSGDVVYMFQEPRLLPWATAIDNVSLASPRVHARSLMRSHTPSAASADLKAEASNLLTALGLSPSDGLKHPAELSGGMQQ